MHGFVFAAVALFAFSAQATDQLPASLTPAQKAEIQQNIKKAEDAQQCFNSAEGEAKMQAMMSRFEKVDQDIKKLCAAGDRQGAAKLGRKAMASMKDDPWAKTVQKCSPEYAAMMGLDTADEDINESICDE